MKEHTHKIELRAKRAPVVELDSEAHAAYVRFSRRKVVRTEPIITSGCIVAVDFDSSNEVVGVELVGVSEFEIGHLMKKAGLQLSKGMAKKASYIPANLETA